MNKLLEMNVARIMFSDGERPPKHVTAKQITDHILGDKAIFLEYRACFL